jgi:uncharacterized metal-binding protein
LADGLLLITVTNGRVIQQRHLKAAIRTLADLTAILEMNRVDTLVSGGVGATVKQMLTEQGIGVIDNVSQSIEELRRSILVDQRFRSGSCPDNPRHGPEEGCPHLIEERFENLNCLTCTNRECLLGTSATDEMMKAWDALTKTDRRMLEAAMDISKESGRRLCRLAEIIYFCIEMHYSRIGLAYCTELEDASRILVNVLGRFFDVVPVCCKIGGITEAELFGDAFPLIDAQETSVVCNPIGQAHVLNRAETQFNLVAGLCVGADALFGRESIAPASTLFVKDKSLANNPIGALYSEYYLKESVSQAAGRHSQPTHAKNREEP